jgi:hypothetical protein
MWSEIDHTTGELDVIAQAIDAFNDPALPWLPDVKKLTLRTLYYLPAIQPAIRNLTNLEHFSCDLRVSADLFERLAALPHLRFMDLRWLPPIATTSVDPHFQSSFPALEGLRLSGTIPSMCALLSLISSPSLLSVLLIAKDASLDCIPPSLFSSLLPPTVPTRTTTLAHFTFTVPSNNRDATNRRLSLAAFAPLYACAGLQTFRVDVDVDPAQLVFTDDDVRAMARAWPMLTVLTISPPHATPRPTPAVHLYTLWALATGCPQLRQLSVEVDADVSQPFRVGDGGAPPSSNHAVVMEDLILYCPPCGDPALVADFLKLAFPKLPASAFHAYPSALRPEDEEKWKAVTAALTYVEA